MMRLCFFAMLLLVATALQAQEFPKDFIGHWEGELLWFQAGKKQPQKVRMQLVIQPSDTAGQNPTTALACSSFSVTIRLSRDCASSNSLRAS